MPLTMTCKCGRSFQANDNQVGKSAVCPHCGVKHFVPTPDTLVHDPNARAQPPAKSQQQQSSTTSSSSGQKMFRCVVCRCKFLPSQVYDDNGDIVCKGCWARDNDDDDD
jgi:DNA-directed RNA polymerase subunit RPC12/RpoP